MLIIGLKGYRKVNLFKDRCRGLILDPRASLLFLTTQAVMPKREARALGSRLREL